MCRVRVSWLKAQPFVLLCICIDGGILRVRHAARVFEELIFPVLDSRCLILNYLFGGPIPTLKIFASRSE